MSPLRIWLFFFKQNTTAERSQRLIFITGIQPKHTQKYFLHLIQTVFRIQTGDSKDEWWLESGQSDDAVLLPQTQRPRLRLRLRSWVLLHFFLRFFVCVRPLRAALVLPCSAALSALRTLSVVGIHVLLRALSHVFQRGATGQAAVLHPRVQTQPVHHVVDTGGEVGGGVYRYTGFKTAVKM